METYTSRLLPFGCRFARLRPARSILWQGERTNQSDIQRGSFDGDGSGKNNPLRTGIY